MLFLFFFSARNFSISLPLKILLQINQAQQKRDLQSPYHPFLSQCFYNSVIIYFFTPLSCWSIFLVISWQKELK